MFPKSKIITMTGENTSTPKRRRLGVGRILRPNLQVFDKDNDVLKSPGVRSSSPFDNNDDLPLPCNQIEYLCDSGNTSSTSSDIPCSPGILSSSVIKNIDNWESLVVSRRNSNIDEVSSTICKELNDIEDISDDMFNSKLEQESSQYKHVDTTLLTSRCEKHFRDHIEESFAAINQSICDIQNEADKKCDKSSLFETKDSFLLDIKESGIVLEDKDSKSNVFSKPKTVDVMRTSVNNNNFYGLPVLAKGLFKSYRNIEKFYDWQEECLNLDAIKERGNLIYALPTSGGKTLVAEVLMLREVLNRKKNALFILPFVAIVQEKMWALSPFALSLDFLIEEYAAGKGHLPPKKRRTKNSIYIATIEKGLALVRTLIELDRLDELGLIVVDELHLIGEPGRGATLETLLATVLFTNKDIQVVGMSATIGNLPQLASFLRADIFTRDFRPVALTEYVKLGEMLHRLQWTASGLEVIPDRQLDFNYSSAGLALDPDRLGGLVAETVPAAACLVFCPTKRNCENVAALLCKLQRREMIQHRTQEREALEKALRSEGTSTDLSRCVRFGVAYHHAGLASDERSLLEQAYRSGVISVLCCTSTLAAGVNLPAARVIVRAPLSLAERRPLLDISFIIASHLGAVLNYNPIREETSKRQLSICLSLTGYIVSGVISVLCCTSTLAAGVNLPAARVIVRAPRVGRAPLSLAAYRQMAGRAGRAGVVDTGESIIICEAQEWPQLRAVLGGGLAPARSVLAGAIPDTPDGSAVNSLLLSAISLKLATTRPRLRSLLDCTLLAHTLTDNSQFDIKTICDESLRSLIQSGAVETRIPSAGGGANGSHAPGQCVVYNNSELVVSELGQAAIKGCMELTTCKQLLEDLEEASRALVVMGGLHLLYLVTHDPGIRPDYRHYYSLYCNLDEEGIQTAKIVGITEMNAIRMMTGKPITNVPERTLSRFYVAMMLHDLWKQVPFPQVAEKYIIPRGTVQSIMTSSCAFAWSACAVCEQMPHLWPFRALFAELSQRLRHCAEPQLAQLMELPNVHKPRAAQLLKAGYKRIEDIARASAEDLVSSVSHLSRKTANHLISAARMMLIEKVENLRAEAEDVMEELKV